MRYCSVVLSIRSRSTTRADNSSSSDNLSNSHRSVSPSAHLLTTQLSVCRRLVPGGTRPRQQRPKDLPQHVCVQAVAGLCLCDLGHVREEVLQGEAVVERDGGGALQDLAYFSAVATSDCAIWGINSEENHTFLHENTGGLLFRQSVVLLGRFRATKTKGRDSLCIFL